MQLVSLWHREAVCLFWCMKWFLIIIIGTNLEIYDWTWINKYLPSTSRKIVENGVNNCQFDVGSRTLPLSAFVLQTFNNNTAEDLGVPLSL
jgi:hypothetical protein